MSLSLRFVAFGVLALVATDVRAALITQTTSFTPGPVSPFLLNSFDPNLGSLERVELTLTGQIVLQASTLPLLSGPVPVPVPYQFSVLPQQGFQGQGSFDVAFAFDAVYPVVIGTATGAGGVVPLPPIPFHFSVTFTAATDLSGIAFPAFVGPAGMPPVFGRREDFVSAIPGFSVPLLAEHRLTPLAVGSGGPPVTPIVVPAGAITAILLYDYTPAQNAPEPACALLLGLGLLWIRSRRNR